MLYGLEKYGGGLCSFRVLESAHKISSSYSNKQDEN